MSDQNPNDTGVFRPPGAEPSWFTPSKRLPRPDARVWPPPESEPRGTSTVPIPVIEDRPAPSRRPWPPSVPSAPRQPAAPAYDGPPAPGTPAAVPYGGPPRAGSYGASPAVAPYGGPPVASPHGEPPAVSPYGGPPVPGAGAPAAPPGAVSLGAAPDPAASAQSQRRRRRRPLPKSLKIGLQVLGAVGLTAAFLAVRGADALQRYEAGKRPLQVQHVAPGQEASLGNAKWRVLGIAISATQQPSTPDRTMLEIDLQATPLNAGGTHYATTPPGLYLSDQAGRQWKVEPWKKPDQLRPGVPGRFTLLSVVPKTLVNQVELMLWPDSYAAEDDAGPALRFAR